MPIPSAARACGADLAYAGTRFLATPEASVDEEYRQMIVESGSVDVMYTSKISGVNANFLIPSIKQAGLDPENLERPSEEIDFGKELNAAKAWKNIWSAGKLFNFFCLNFFNNVHLYFRKRTWSWCNSQCFACVTIDRSNAP